MAEPMTWWRRPELRDDQRRSVGWLELFFDLVFVVVVSRLAHYLAGHLTPRAVLEFTIQFAGIFWIWNAFTYYTERFESGGLEDRFYTFLALLPVAGLAIFAEGGLAEHHDEFAVAYICARAVNMIGWFRAARNVEAFRPVAKRFFIGFAVTTTLLLVSMESGSDQRLWLWGIAVLLDVLTPSLTMKQQASLPPISRDRFPERFGLFTLLVLGETVVGVISSISNLSDGDDLRRSTWATAPLGLALGFGLWWLYFDFVARRPPRQKVTTILTWIYLHLVAVTMIAVTGAGISLAITDDALGVLQSGSQRLVATGVGGALIAVALLETTLMRRKDEPTDRLMSPFLKVATGGLALLAGWTSEQWSTTSLFLLLLTAIVIPCAYGALVWFAQPSTAAVTADASKPATATEGRLIVDSPPPPLPTRRETARLTRLTESGSRSRRPTVTATPKPWNARKVSSATKDPTDTAEPSESTPATDATPVTASTGPDAVIDLTDTTSTAGPDVVVEPTGAKSTGGPDEVIDLTDAKSTTGSDLVVEPTDVASPVGPDDVIEPTDTTSTTGPDVAVEPTDAKSPADVDSPIDRQGRTDTTSTKGRSDPSDTTGPTEIIEIPVELSEQADAPHPTGTEATAGGADAGDPSDRTDTTETLVVPADGTPGSDDVIDAGSGTGTDDRKGAGKVADERPTDSTGTSAIVVLPPDGGPTGADAAAAEAPSSVITEEPSAAIEPPPEPPKRRGRPRRR